MAAAVQGRRKSKFQVVEPTLLDRSYTDAEPEREAPSCSNNEEAKDRDRRRFDDKYRAVVERRKERRSKLVLAEPAFDSSSLMSLVHKRVRWPAAGRRVVVAGHIGEISDRNRRRVVADEVENFDADCIVAVALRFRFLFPRLSVVSRAMANYWPNVNVNCRPKFESPLR